MSKDKSKKWVIAAPLFYNYAGILVCGNFSLGILEFPTMSSPSPFGDLIIKNSRILSIDPRVKSGDVTRLRNSRIPMVFLGVRGYF